MANPNHLEVLRQGVEVWNRWRDENPDIEEPDLSEANLSGADLSEANLSGANLSGANLSDETFLSETNLSEADLQEANLSGANLSGVTLLEANLSRANLSEANLQGAHLSGTNLVEANLKGADLATANLSEANLSKANLSKADLEVADLYKADLYKADLRDANLAEADLSRASLRDANFSGANLSGANLFEADLTGDPYGWGTNLSRADLSGAQLPGANLSGVNLSEADLSRANLSRANLSEADLTRADLAAANLEYSILVRADFQGSKLTNSRIYGISAWDLRLSDKTEQSNLIISPDDSDGYITVDDLEVAQFVYLLIDNRKLRNVIDTMTSKAVLILGNFAPERKEVLEVIRERLRDRGYLPILFDFEGPQNKNLMDTVTTVARLSRFVIADITQPRSVPAELDALVPALPSLPIQPLIERSENPYAMFVDLLQRDSVLKVHRYASVQDLLESFDEEVLAPAEKKLNELEVARLRAMEEKL